MDLSQAKTESLGHLGLIAATIKNSGLMEKVDSQLGVTKGVKYGQRVGAMILNGLGFINTALYMTPRFFHDKPIDLLLGDGLTAAQLNDDSLGRCLDKIAQYGTTKWFSELALEIVSKAGLLSRTVHIDSTTLSLYGTYEGKTNANLGPQPLLGYSKDHRADLKQVTLQCVSMGKESLPIWMEALDGNSSDKKSFPETVRRVAAFYKAVESAPKLCFIGDSALYGKSLNELNVEWLTRVPETYSECKDLCHLRQVSWQPTQDERYKIFPYQPNQQNERWLLVRSEPAFHRETETLLRRHSKIFDELNKLLWHCSCEIFSCINDAKKAIDKIIKTKGQGYLVDYVIHEKPQFKNKGRPRKDVIAEHFVYQIEVQGIATDYKQIIERKETLGRFVLATNICDPDALSSESMLSDYKEQGTIEHGFRFIKNDTFGLDEVYLKKPERIGALMGIMTLCLLIYGLTQYQLRSALEKNNEELPNQKGKPTQTPTLMWIFTLFSSITLLNIGEPDGKIKRVIMNMQPLHQKIVLLLGDSARKMYFLSEQLTLPGLELNQKTWLKWCGI